MRVNIWFVPRLLVSIASRDEVESVSVLTSGFCGLGTSFVLGCGQRSDFFARSFLWKDTRFLDTLLCTKRAMV